MKSDIQKKLRRVKPKDIETEKNIIIGLIVSDKFSREITPILKQDYLQTKIAKTICTWCTEFYQLYETAPKLIIQDLFNQKKDFIDPDLADVIEDFLTNLSTEYEETDVYDHDYWITKVVKYLQLRAYRQYADEIQEAVDNEDTEKAEDLRSTFLSVQKFDDPYEDMLSESNIDRLIDSYGIDDIERESKILFRPPGALRTLIGDIEKGSFIGFLGREKIGKSFFFTELAMQAIKQGKNVAVFEVGDMTMDQFDIRAMSYITSKPARKKYAGKFLRPVLDCYYNQQGGCPHGSDGIIKFNDDGEPIGMLTYEDDEDHVPCTECYKDRSLRWKFKGSIWWKYTEKSVWTWSEAKQAAQLYNEYFTGKFKRVAWGMGQATVEDIDRKLTTWYEKDNFFPHLVIIDYADILAASRQTEKRHQEDEKWRGIRNLSQKWQNCMTTGSQSDAKGYKKRSLDLTNFNEDKRKFGHVTHMCSFNKTTTEEKYGCMRVGSLIMREEDIAIVNEVTVLQSLRMGRPYLGSFVGSVPGV